jgi:hypothetical protein
MGNIQNLDALLTRSAGNNSGNPDNVFFMKISSVSGNISTAPSGAIAGYPISCWRYDGYPCGNISALPASGEIPTSATIGALRFSGADNGFERYITQIAAMPNGINAIQGGTVILYDRLYHRGLISATSTAEQVFTSISLTRNTTGKGNFAFFEIAPSATSDQVAQIGATQVTATVEYVNSQSQTCSSIIALGGTNYREADRVIFLGTSGPFGGIKAINRVRLSATTGASVGGTFNAVIGKPLAIMTMKSTVACGWRDFITGMPGIPKIEDNACLAFIMFTTATGLHGFLGMATTIQD